MDGYSVEQAAEVLGIPQGRVWELIARGVLAGASEGGATMRVYLKPAAPPVAADRESQGKVNGDRGSNGESHGELSPFRELLTEFRNLTERYGQALLALGEARGEVAALRGRVDVLEARMEMRLPMRPASTVAWEMPGYPPAPPRPPAEPEAESESEPPDVGEPAAAMHGGEPAQEAGTPTAGASASADVEPVEPAEARAAAPAESQADSGKRRVTGGRAAMAGLAEALARAEDPALLDLPGAREAAEAFAALRKQAGATGSGVADVPTPLEPVPEAAPQAADELAVESAPEAADELAVESAFEVAAGDAAGDSPEADAPYPDALAAYAPTIEQADEPEEAAVGAGESFDAGSEAEGEPAFVEPESAGGVIPTEPLPEPPAEREGLPPPTSSLPPDSPYTSEVVEPDWFADGDFAWLESPEPEPVPAPIPEPAPPEPEPSATTEPASFEDAGAEPSAEAEHLDVEHEQQAVDAIQDAFAEPEPEPPEPEPKATAEWPETDRPQDAGALPPSDLPPSDPPPSDPPPSDPPPSDPPPSEPTASFGLFRGQPEPAQPMTPHAEPPPRATRDEEALMWLGDEFEAAGLEVAAPGWRSDQATPEPEAPVLQLSEAEIEQLAATEGWDRDEIKAIRELVGRQAEESPTPEPPAPESPDELQRWIPPQQASFGPASDPDDWLRGRRGPAADAYRRLRRLFQG